MNVYALAQILLAHSRQPNGLDGMSIRQLLVLSRAFTEELAKRAYTKEREAAKKPKAQKKRRKPTDSTRVQSDEKEGLGKT